MDSLEAMSKLSQAYLCGVFDAGDAASRAFRTVGEQSAGHYSATRYLPEPRTCFIHGAAPAARRFCPAVVHTS